MTEFVKDKDCLVCGPGVLIELDTSVTLEKVIFYVLAIALVLSMDSVFIRFFGNIIAYQIKLHVYFDDDKYISLHFSLLISCSALA